MRPKIVLVVDDHEDSRIICGSILRHSGYTFLEAENGGEALQRVREQRPDVILLDLSLPVLDGWQVAAVLRQKADTAQIPLIALTAHALDADRERVLAAGFDSCLVKPCSPRHVLAEVERFIGPADQPGDVEQRAAGKGSMHT